MSHEFVKTSASFSRPADTNGYAAKDVISNSTTATTKMAFNVNLEGGTIVKMLVKTNCATFIGKVRLWLYSVSTDAIAGDNVAMNMLKADSVIGYIDTELFATGTACSFGGTSDSIAFQRIQNTTIYGVLTAIDAITTPGNATQITVELVTENY